MVAFSGKGSSVQPSTGALVGGIGRFLAMSIPYSSRVVGQADLLLHLLDQREFYLSELGKNCLPLLNHCGVIV